MFCWRCNEGALDLDVTAKGRNSEIVRIFFLANAT